MAIDISTVRSRRSLLAATVGAAAASVASALGRPQPAAAASPTTFTSAVEGLPAVTALSTVASGTLAVALVADAASHEGTAIKATASHVSGYTTGIHGIAKGFGGYAVKGYGDNSTGWTRGVGGESAGDTGVGVDGYATHPSGATKGMFGINYSTSGTGVAGYANASTGSTAGVVGQANSAGGTGVLGYSGGSSFAPPAPKAKTGVYGEADQDAAARGVWGRSATGSGVYGQSTSGQGVRGYSATGSAGFFATSDPKKGSALRTAGRLRFDHCVGIATIASGASSTTVTPGIALTSASAVVATLQGSAGAATTTVGRVVVSDAADTFTIHLTAAATVNVKVAWHVFG